MAGKTSLGVPSSGRGVLGWRLSTVHPESCRRHSLAEMPLVAPPAFLHLRLLSVSAALLRGRAVAVAP